jgi:hypothetical protein
MKFVNLTPHVITLIDGPTFAPSGSVARVKVSRRLVCLTEVDGTDNPNIRFFAPSFGEVEGLPEKLEGVALIVSAMVRNALPDREDLISPGNLERDKDGNVIGCDGFDWNFDLI